MGLKVGTTFSVMASEEVKGGFQGVTGEGAGLHFPSLPQSDLKLSGNV